MAKILFVCGNPPHPIHKKFAEIIGVDFFNYPEESFYSRLKGLFQIPKGYDIYFTEGLFSYVVLSRIINHLNKKVKIINLFADPRLYQITSGKKFNLQKRKRGKYPFLKRSLQKRLIRKLDGAMCVGNYQKDLLAKLAPKIQSKAIKGFIYRKEFFNINSPLNKKNILFIGGGPDYDYKGVDYLINVFREVKKSVPETKLFIIGGGWEEFKKKIKDKDILFEGNQDLEGIKKYIKQSSIYCHFGRGDSFPISTLESMASGLPCMISNETGTKELIQNKFPDFVVSMKSVDKPAKKIIKYFKEKNNKKKIIAKEFKKIVSNLNETNGTNDFKYEFHKLLKGINEK